MERKNPKKLITIKHAAEITDLAPKTIQNKVYAGELQRYGTRGKITLDLEEVYAKLVYGHPEHNTEKSA